MDITHSGIDNNDAKIQGAMEHAISGSYLNSVPGSLTFNKVTG